jgi:SAM-dependent methyltransferase
MSPKDRGSKEARSPKELVREGWNRVSTIYRPDGRSADVFGHTLADHQRWLRPILRLKNGSKILDLGCGCGVPDARLLARRYEVVGVDLSDVQIARARKLVPAATFLHTDMTAVRFLAGSLDAAICLYSIIHVPLEEQPSLIDRIGRWIRPGGPFLLIAGATAYTGTESGWLGSSADMYWSHTDGDSYARWLEHAGFELVRRERIPEGESTHELFECRKSRAPVPDLPLAANLL